MFKSGGSFQLTLTQALCRINFVPVCGEKSSNSSTSFDEILIPLTTFDAIHRSSNLQLQTNFRVAVVFALGEIDNVLTAVSHLVDLNVNVLFIGDLINDSARAHFIASCAESSIFVIDNIRHR